MKRKMLMLAYHFPPAKTVSLRSYFACREFQRHFESVKVITVANRNPQPGEPFTFPHEDLRAVPAFDYRTILSYFNKTQVSASETGKGRLVQFLIKLFDSFPFNLLLGEGGLGYITATFFAARREIRKNGCTHIYSSFRPYADHVAAYLLKVFYPKIFWIADFRDLHVDVDMDNVFLPSFQRWCNRLILSKADVVTTVSGGLAKHLAQLHPNVCVLPNGIGELVMERQPRRAFSKFTIAYTGSMFRDRRDPNFFLETLSGLLKAGKMDRGKVEILHAGKHGATWISWLKTHGLESQFTDLGFVSRAEAIQIQQNTHLNLMLTYAIPELKGQLTGKLYEYLAAIQPVLLNLNGCRDEELEEIFEETGAGLLVRNRIEDKKPLEDFLLKLYNEWQVTGSVAPVVREASLEKYKWENMMKTFLKEKVFSLQDSKNVQSS